MATRATRKAPTNLSLRSALVQRAKALGLNLSDVLDAALEQAILEAEKQQWLAENRKAIDEYNELVSKHGLFSDGRRRF